MIASLRRSSSFKRASAWPIASPSSRFAALKHPNRIRCSTTFSETRGCFNSITFPIALPHQSHQQFNVQSAVFVTPFCACNRSGRRKAAVREHGMRPWAAHPNSKISAHRPKVSMGTIPAAVEIVPQSIMSIATRRASAAVFSSEPVTHSRANFRPLIANGVPSRRLILARHFPRLISNALTTNR